MTRLCVPLTDIFRRNQGELLPLVAAVSFKQVADDEFDGKEHMLECSLGIADPAFRGAMEETGLLAALRSGRFTSFACDLGPAWERVVTGVSANGYPRYLPGAGPMSEKAYLLEAERNVEFLRSRFPGTIKVENLNYFPTGAYELVCDADFIAAAVQRLEIELLLDVGHLTVSAANLGVAIDGYLAGLPLDRVSEVQLSGSGVVNGIWEDTHELPAERDMSILRRVLTRAAVRYVTLEYYKDDRRLVTGYRELSRWLGDPAEVAR